MRNAWLLLTPLLVLGASSSAHANLKAAQDKATAAVAVGKGGVAGGELPGTVEATNFAGAIPLSLMEDGSIVEDLSPYSIYIKEPKGRARATRPSLFPGGTFLTRRFDPTTAKYEATFGQLSGGRYMVYNPKTKVLVRELPDGRWGVQKNVNGRFSAQTVVATLHDANEHLYPGYAARRAATARYMHIGGVYTLSTTGFSFGPSLYGKGDGLVTSWARSGTEREHITLPYPSLGTSKLRTLRDPATRARLAATLGARTRAFPDSPKAGRAVVVKAR